MLQSLTAAIIWQLIPAAAVPGAQQPNSNGWHKLIWADGSNPTYSNAWKGWYDSSPHPLFPKLATLPIDQIKIEYDGKVAIAATPRCETLVDVLSFSGMHDQQCNDNSFLWSFGHQEWAWVSRSDDAEFSSKGLRIGVGDGTVDCNDYAMFYWKDGNGGGDFAGNGQHALGSESAFQTGTATEVKISGRECVGKPTTKGQAPIGMFNLLLSAPGRDRRYRNNWSGWYATAAAPDPTFPRIASLPIDQLKIEYGSNVAIVETPGCDTLANHLASEGLTQSQCNDGTQKWNYGHAYWPWVKRTPANVFKSTGGLLIGVGDGTNDCLDYGIFYWDLLNGQRADFVGDRVNAIGSEGTLATGWKSTVRLYGRACNNPVASQMLNIPATPTGQEWATLVSATGTSTNYGNHWSGWYSTTPDATFPKLATVMVDRVMISYGDYWAEAQAPQCDTLVNHLRSAGMKFNQCNDGSATWTAGHGHWPWIAVSSYHEFKSPNLLIGVGDGTNDCADYALFYWSSDNAAGDFLGRNKDALGSERFLHTGFGGQVTLKGRKCGASLNTPSPVAIGAWEELMTEMGSNVVHGNTWSGWYEPNTDFPLLSSMPISKLRFDMDGDVAVAETPRCAPLITLLKEAGMAKGQCNDGTGGWVNGHQTWKWLGSAPSTHGMDLRIGVGDKTHDCHDYAIMMLQDGNSLGDFLGNGALAVGSEAFFNSGYKGQITLSGWNCDQASHPVVQSPQPSPIPTVRPSHPSTSNPSSAPTPRPTNPPPSPTYSPLATHIHPGQWAILMESIGSDRAYANDYSGWYAYDSNWEGLSLTEVDQLKFEWDDEWAIVQLPYCTDLVNLLYRAGMRANQCNDGSVRWNNGHMKLPYLSVSSTSHFGTSGARIGVGDGSHDCGDYTVFMFEGGNGKKDFSGQKVKALGSESVFNTGYTGKTTIRGRGCAPSAGTYAPTPFPVAPTENPTITPSPLAANVVHLMSGNGNDPTYSNKWKGWYDVPKPQTRWPALYTTPISHVVFEWDNKYSMAKTPACDTLVNLLHKAGMRQGQCNHGAPKWKNGHQKWAWSEMHKILPSSTKHAIGSNLRIGVGDGTHDCDDYTIFMFQDGNAANDFAGSMSLSVGSESMFNTAYADEIRIFGKACTPGISQPPTPAPVAPPTAFVPGGWELVMDAAGSSVNFSNKWKGWYKSTGNMEFPKISGMDIGAVMFKWNGQEAWVETPRCAPLTDLLEDAGMKMGQCSDGSQQWIDGHETWQPLRRSDTKQFPTDKLRIGVGDGSHDCNDFTIFMFEDGNSNGDFVGSRTVAIGSEAMYNTGYKGQVQIYGRPCGITSVPSSAPTVPNPVTQADLLHKTLKKGMVELMHAKGSMKYGNKWDGWYGPNTVFPKLSTVQIDRVAFVVNGEVAIADPSGCLSLVGLLKRAGMVEGQCNTDSQLWQYGHETWTWQKSDNKYFPAEVLRIGVGDHSKDCYDYGLFMFDGPGPHHRVNKVIKKDFFGGKVNAVGSELRFHTGHGDDVTIYGRPCGSSATTTHPNSWTPSSLPTAAPTFMETAALTKPNGKVIRKPGKNVLKTKKPKAPKVPKHTKTPKPSKIHHANKTAKPANTHHPNKTAKPSNTHHPNKTAKPANTHHPNKTVKPSNTHHPNKTVKPSKIHHGGTDRPTKLPHIHKHMTKKADRGLPNHAPQPCHAQKKTKCKISPNCTWYLSSYCDDKGKPWMPSTCSELNNKKSCTRVLTTEGNCKWETTTIPQQGQNPTLVNKCVVFGRPANGTKCAKLKLKNEAACHSLNGCKWQAKKNNPATGVCKGHVDMK